VLEPIAQSFFGRADFDQERAALRDKYNKRAQELFGNLGRGRASAASRFRVPPTGQVIFIPLIDGKMPESPEALNKAMAAED